MLGVSTDEASSHAAFAQKFNLPFPLLADTTGAMCQRWGTKGSTNARRVTFLLDGDGRIVQVWDPVTVDGHADAVESELTKLR